MSTVTGTLEQRVAHLEKYIKIDGDGTVTLTTPTKLVIKAAAVQIEGVATIVLKGGVGVEVSSLGTLLLKGGGTTSVEGGIVRLNNGSSPAARVGSGVVGIPPAVMKVNTGNGTVLV